MEHPRTCLNTKRRKERMPDNGTEPVVEVKPEVKLETKPEAPKDIILVIRLNPAGDLSVQAPGNGQMYDEMLCDYLMKKASRYIEAHNFKAGQPKIQPHQSMPERIRGMFNQRKGR